MDVDSANVWLWCYQRRQPAVGIWLSLAGLLNDEEIVSFVDDNYNDGRVEGGGEEAESRPLCWPRRSGCRGARLFLRTSYQIALWYARSPNPVRVLRWTWSRRLEVLILGRTSVVAPEGLAAAAADLARGRRASERSPVDEVLKPLKDVVRLAARARQPVEKKGAAKARAAPAHEKDVDLADEDQDVLAEL